MKTTISVLIILLCCCTPVTACDICGCGAGSTYIGILPEFNKKTIGLRYRFNSLTTHIGAGGQSSYLTTDERFHTTELWGGWNISKRFRVMGTLPYNFVAKKSQQTTLSKSGPGDIAAQAFYELINDRRTVGSKLMINSLWIGGGVKLPTGTYEPSAKDPASPSANLFQLGTGSFDFTANAMYDLRIQDAGVNTAISYRANTKNRDNYRYGDKFSVALQVYHKFRVLKAITVAPNAGVLYDVAQKDFDDRYVADISGGKVLMATAGLEARLNRLSIGSSIQHPVSQRLAAGSVEAGGRAMVHVSFIL